MLPALLLLLILLSPAFPEVIARINGREVTREEFLRAFEVYRKEVLHFNPGKPTPEDRRRFFFEYIKGILVEEVAGDMGVSVSEEEVSERLKKWGRKEADPVLRRLIRKEILLEKIADRLTGDLRVTEEEIKVYYLLNRREFYLPSQIKLLRVLAEDREKARKAYRLLKRGGELRPEEGIRIGKERWYSLHSLPRKVRRKLYPYRKGVVSRPIRLETGYLILKITDRRKAGFLPLSEVRDRVRRKLLNVKREEVLKSWFREVLKGYRLELYPQRLE